MMSPVLPIVSVSMAESLKKLGFSDVTPFCYNDGDLTEYQENLLLAPSLQEVQAWIGRRKRMDVLVYREVFFNEVGKFYAVIINRKDGTNDTKAEYQKMIDADKSVKRLSAYTTRQRELAEIEDPDERNPKHAGRPKKPYTEKAQSKAIRVIGSIADQVKTINDFIREHPYEEDRVKFLLSSVIEQLK